LGVVVTAVAAGAMLVLRGREPSPVVSSDGGKQLAATQAEYEPHIFSVTPIFPQARQRIIIRGRGFGLHVAYAHTDSPFLAIRDLTANWAAGRTIPQNTDDVSVDVENWTDVEIVISGFSGEYGLNEWKLTTGDELEIAVWNPQSAIGPALYHVTVIP
jgi:hypothetical protein